MRFQTFLFLLLTLSAIGTIDAGRSRGSSYRGSSSRGSSSRGSSSRGSSSRGSSSHSSSSTHGSSGSYGSSSHSSSSTHGSSGSYGSSSHSASSTHGSSGTYGSSSHSASSPHGSSASYGGSSQGASGSHGSSGSSGSSSRGGHTEHQQSANSNTNFLNAEGGGARRPAGSPQSKPGVVTDSKQTASPHAPSAPIETNPYQGRTPSHEATNNPPWGNPHLGINQPNVPGQTHPPWSNPQLGTNQPNAPSQTYPPWGNPHLGTNQPNAPGQTHPPWSNPHLGTNQPNAPGQTYPPWGNPHLGTNQPNAPGQTHPPWSNPHLGTNQPNAPGQTHPPWSNPHLGTNQPNAPGQTHPPWSNPHLGTNQPNAPGQTHPPWSNPHLGINQPNAPGQTHPSWSHPSTLNHPAPSASSIGFKDHVYPSSNPPIHQQNSMPMGNPYSLHPSGSIHSASGPTYYPQQPQMFAQPAMQPYVPGQTVLVMQQDSSRGLGQMVKEALVYSTINAGVNRLINPHTHYVGNQQASSPTSTTQITHNNYYGNAAPGTDNTAGSSAPQGTVPGTNPSIAPGGSTPVSGTTFNSGGDTGNGGAATVNGADVTATAGTSSGTRHVVHHHHHHATQSNPTATNQTNSTAVPSNVDNSFYKISDNDIFRITEDLFAMSLDISKYINMDLQIRPTSINVTDEAKKPLFKIDPILLNYPTIYVTHTLYDKYGHDFRDKVNYTQEIREHENLLIDTYLDTNVMATAMKWLGDRGFIDLDDFERKDVLRRIWFTIFSGSTCGFERVFESENYGTAIIGVQDWLYFAGRESSGRINYMSYVDKLKLGNTASLLKLNFEMDGIVRPNATIFVGTTPELEMSLYTICLYTRPNDVCPISLGGTRFNIYTHSFTYFGKVLMDLAFPIL